jgi:signal transduction histidine kinase
VVHNLVVNASEAMSAAEGRVLIRTGTLVADSAFLSRCVPPGELAPGDYILIEVADSGCGMSKAVRERAFEPFFTTKFTGRGLGLATVLGIVRAHGGAVQVDSEPDRGTTVRVLLPPAPSSNT